MPYVVSNYFDWDLKLKTDRTRPLVPKWDVVVQYVQAALVDLKISKVLGRPLKIDGLWGPQMSEAIKMFQAACGIPVTGVLDQRTYHQLDWRVYGELSGAWKHAPKQTDSLGDGGPAIIARGGKAYNEILRTKGHDPQLPAAAHLTINGAKWSLVPVDVIGRTREGARLSDVPEAQFSMSFGYEGAVRRNAVGTSSWSTHWAGVAGDDMADQDKDRIIETSELMREKAEWDYMMMRAQALGDTFEKTYRYVQLPGEASVRSKYSPSRGIDGLAIAVVGNRPLGEEGFMFPLCSVWRDVSWNGERNTAKCLSTSHHVYPQHLHTDCVVGAPYGSPFV